MTRIWSSSQRRFSVIALCFSLIIANSNLASASRGGLEDSKNKFTVGFTYNDDTVPSVCSGILIAPKIIVTARHCVRNDSGIDGSDYIFTNPGARIDGPGTPTKISRVVISDEDLAFILLDAPLSGATYLRVANRETIEGLQDSAPLTGHGYGAVFETQSPYSSIVRKYPLEWRKTGKDPKLANTYELTSGSATACRGDSGGPITATLPNGEQSLVAVMSGAAGVENACGTPGTDGLYRMRVVLVEPYLSLIPEYSYPKITRITCTKGTKRISVRGVNPKCPKGYRIKK